MSITGRNAERSVSTRKGTLHHFEELESRLVPSSEPLQVVGNQLENPTGQPVVLRGLNVEGDEGYENVVNPPGLTWSSDANGVAVDNAVTAALDVWDANLMRSAMSWGMASRI